MPSFGILGTESSADLVDALTARRARISVCSSTESATAAVELLNHSDVAVVHLDHDVADLLGRLSVPSIVVADKSLKKVTAQVRSALQQADHVVASSDPVRDLLNAEQADITVIAPGPDMGMSYIRLAQSLITGQRVVS